MIPILYQTITEGTVPSHYGLGPLSDAISTKVKEVLNGIDELTMEYPANGIHADDIQPNYFIKAKPNFTDDPQIFRIYKVGKTINGKFTVYGQHISYDLGGKIIQSGTATSCATACALLQAQAGNFSITTDKATSAAFKVDVPSSVRSWFGGKAGSLLDVYGGEWHYDNYSCVLKGARGSDRGVTIRYGKNLTALSQELNMSNLVTGIIPYCVINEVVTVGTRVSTGLSLDVTRDAAIDFSQNVDPESGTALTTQLANCAAAYISNNNLTTVGSSITLDFVQSGELTERVDLGDTVHIYFEALGITASAKCVSTTWNVLEGRYVQTTFGSLRANIADTLAAQAAEISVAPTRSDVARATAMITGNLGGYVILHDSDSDGQPDEILIMDTPDISTAVKVWRWNNAGLGYSSTGYAGTYGTAITADGKIVADYVSTGTLSANLIKAGVISDTHGRSSINMTTGAAKLYQLIAKNSFKIVNSLNLEMGSFFPYTYGGALQLNNSVEEGRANFFVNSSGSFLYLYEPDGTQLVALFTSNSGAVLGMNDTNGTQLVNMYTSNGGAGLKLNNTSGTKNIDIHSETNSGVISIENAAGKSVVHGWGNPGGWFQVRDGSGNTTIELNGNNGQIICVSVHQTSSRKVKDNIKPLESEEAAKILDLEPVSFDYKNKELGTNKRGFIAEDVAEVLPNLVTPEEGERTASLDYIGMIPYLVGVVKEQNERIKALEKKINELGG